MLIQRIHQIPDVAQADILCPLRESGVKTAARMPKRADALMPVLLHPGERLLQPLIGIRLIQDGLDPGAQRLIQGIRLESLELDCQLLQAVLAAAIRRARAGICSNTSQMNGCTTYITASPMMPNSSEFNRQTRPLMLKGRSE